MRITETLFERNKYWAKKMTEINPDFFSQLHKQQTPQYLWIGCSDSRVSSNEIIDLLPGEIFVHRNIANVVVHTDLNCLSVIQYAVEVLNIKHIIVCGHYGCGGVKAAMETKEHGLIDNWLRHIQDVHRMHQMELDGISDENDKFRKLCEKNVIEQVVNVCNTTIVQKAWRKQNELTIYGWIYSIKNGILKDLDVCVADVQDLNSMRDKHTLRPQNLEISI